MRRYQERRSGGGAFKFIVVLIIIFLIWGFIGDKQVEKKGLSCKIGWKDKLCWSWNAGLKDKAKNVTSDVNDSLSDLNG